MARASQRCGSCRAILLVPILGNTAARRYGEPLNLVDSLDAVAEEMRSAGLEVELAMPVSASARGYSEERLQHELFAVLAELRRAYPLTPHYRAVIGVMNEDGYLASRRDWSWAFGYRERNSEGGGHGVISLYHMYDTDPGQIADTQRRLSVMVGKYSGLLACDFVGTSNPTDVMYNRILSASDLDRMNPIICE